VNKAAKTWAIVVGIDAYTDPKVPDLQGAVADAVAFRDWLVALGVPKRQIRQHAAPTDRSRALLAGSRWLDVTPQRIDDSIVRLEQVTDGERLIVYLAGHGLFEPEAGRLFLLPDFSESSPWNMGLDKYVKRFLAMRFSRQFLFVDGCQNLPYSQSARQKIDGQMFAGRTGFAYREGNLLVGAYAAALGQRAKEIGGRGVFTKYLLEGLDLESPSSRAVVLDFSSGERWLDLRKLVTGYVRPFVESAVRDPQTPNVKVEPTETDEACPFFTFRDPTPGKITVTISPSAAVPVVQLISIAVRGQPLWSYSQPVEPAVQVDVPFELRVPLGQTVDAYCVLREGAQWDGTVDRRFEVVAHTPLKFELYDARGSTAPPSVEVRTVSSGGDVLANQFEYDDVAHAAGFTEEVRDEALVAPGVRLEHHETGPVFRLQTKRGVAAVPAVLLRTLSSRRGNAILDATDPGVGIATFATGLLPLAVRPKIQVRLPRGGAPALAGQLAERKLLWIGPPENAPTEPLYESAVGEGPEGARSLASLEKNSIVDVEPGHVLVRLDLPWGTWTKTVSASDTGSAIVSLPNSVGKPPLRVRLREELGRRGDTYLFGVGRPLDKPELRNGLWGTSSSAFRETRPRSAQWAFMPPHIRWLDDPRAVGIATAGRFAFPLLPGRSLAAERSGGDLRVEPLALVPSAAWDVLLFRGLLDDLPAARALELTAAKWKDALLGLAGAYAVYALPAEKRPPGVLEDVLHNLKFLGRRAGGRRMPDVDLLRAALRAFGGDDVSRTDVDGLRRWAEHGAVPVLRWGVPLAIRLIEDDVLPRATFARWLEALHRIETSLSPVSVWTVWRP
jgi:hypothetical protein